MGQFTIVIHGVGSHHNFVTNDAGQIQGRKIDYDADLMFADFVSELKAKGHSITGATFTVGGMYGQDGIIPRDYKPASALRAGSVTTEQIT